MSTQALDTGDPLAAGETARAGIRGCPYDERSYRAGMRAAAARGATGEVKALMRDLNAAVSADQLPAPPRRQLNPTNTRAVILGGVQAANAPAPELCWR